MSNNSLQVSSSHITQLDSLRGLAMFAVMVWHFLPQDGYPWGPLGVNMFFVMSGYLVTRTLLRARLEANPAHPQALVFLKRFYVRRYLRLFPAYYCALLMGVLLGIPPIRQSLWWHLSYLTNFYIAHKGDWQPYISHLWYLAALEQFYIVWPSILLFTPRPYLLPVVLLAIGLGPVLRLLMVDIDKITFFVLPLGYLDLLGIGALLAFLTHSSGLGKFRVRLTSLWIGGLLITLMIWVYFTNLPEVPRLVAGNVPMTLFCAWLVLRASQASSGMLSDLLETRVLVYLGRISYSVYIWHLFMIYIFYFLFPKIGLHYPHSLGLRFASLVTLSIAFGSLSWYCVERPFDRLRRCWE